MILLWYEIWYKIAVLKSFPNFSINFSIPLNEGVYSIQDILIPIHHARSFRNLSFSISFQFLQIYQRTSSRNDIFFNLEPSFKPAPKLRYPFLLLWKNLTGRPSKRDNNGYLWNHWMPLGRRCLRRGTLLNIAEKGQKTSDIDLERKLRFLDYPDEMTRNLKWELQTYEPS